MEDNRKVVIELQDVKRYFKVGSETVKALPELYTEFDKAQWTGLLDSMTVHSKDKITFTLTSGMEIEA